MSTTANDNKIAALKTAAKQKSIETKERIMKAISEMEANNIPITFQAVAKYAQVSKTTLYADKRIVERIKSNRDNSEILQRMLD